MQFLKCTPYRIVENGTVNEDYIFPICITITSIVQILDSFMLIF